jgi:hypothetical protein
MLLNLNRKYFVYYLNNNFFVFVLTFRPMCFSITDADFFCDKFETVVKECQKKKDEKQEL